MGSAALVPPKPFSSDDIFRRLELGETPDAISASAESTPELTPNQRADKLADEKMAEDSALEGQIREQENLTGTNVLGSSMLGAASMIGANSLQMTGRDSKSLEAGYRNAQGAFDAGKNQALQNRAFIKDSMGRTGDEIKTRTANAELKTLMGTQRRSEATETGAIAAENAKNQSTLDQVQIAKTNTDPLSQRNRTMANADKSIIQAMIAKGGKNAASLKTILGNYDNGIGKLIPTERDSFMKQVAELNEKSKGFTLHSIKVGDKDGFVVVDNDTGVPGRPIMETRTTGVDIAKAKGANKVQLSDKQTASISSYDRAISEIDGILADKDKHKIDTGPLAYLSSISAKTVGRDTPVVTAFRQRVGVQLVDYIKGISGTAVTGAERENLRSLMPSMTDNDETFIFNMNRLKERLTKYRQIDLDNYENQGKNTAPFNTDTPPASGTKPPPASGTKPPPASGAKPIDDDEIPEYDGELPPVIKKGK